ncbi:MAG TPA: carboxypeptidase-like regulatory domain-containing protein [Longimicrobium sp.]|nr:carboxypeptidase-like regulatory domain-containing protein [Longimicrobium sp.]
MTNRPASGRSIRISLAALAAALLACAAPAGAQTLHGRLTFQDSGRPVGGALVALVDAEGREVRSAISTQDGRYRLTAPAAGSYRLRVERVGHESVLAGPFPLAAGQEREHRLTLSIQTITLEAVRAEAGRRCTPRPGQQDGLALQRVWDEARKALSSTVRAAEESGSELEFVTFERVYTPLRQLVSDTTARHRGLVSRPFSAISAEELAENGFVRARDGELTYYGPDAEVLLSDIFLERHCFHLRDGTGEQEGLIGLAFEPLRNRRRPDVQGVLWLDRRTSELRHLEFDFAGIHPSGGARADGRVDFARTPAGTWIVRKWVLRFPVANIRITEGMPANYRLTPARAFKEVGGEVVGGSSGTN